MYILLHVVSYNYYIDLDFLVDRSLFPVKKDSTKAYEGRVSAQYKLKTGGEDK